MTLQKEDEISRRLAVVFEWAQRHAKRSENPGQYLDSYQNGIAALRSGLDMDGRSMDRYDPVKVAAELEAFAAWRRVQGWYDYVNVCEYPRYAQRGRSPMYRKVRDE